MRKRPVKYTAGEIGRVRVVEDFLPAPDALVTRRKNPSKRIVKYTSAELRAMEKRGESKTDWKAAAKKPLPSGDDPDDAMEEIETVTTEMPRPPRRKP